MTDERHHTSLWFFIGILLTIYGVLITGSGLYDLVSPPERQTVLADLHAPIWWGGVTLALGCVYVALFRPGRKG